MGLIENSAYVILFLTGIYILIRIFKKLLKKERIFLSEKTKARANWKFNKLLKKFKKEHKRSPTRDELFRIVIQASHITIRRRGNKAHWGRQKVRKFVRKASYS